MTLNQGSYGGTGVVAPVPIWGGPDQYQFVIYNDPRTNLMTDPSFEDGVAVAYPYGGGYTTCEISTDAAYGGTKSVKVVLDGLAAQPGGMLTHSDIQVADGLPISVGAWVNMPASQNFKMGARFMSDSGGSYLGQSDDLLVGTGSWAWYTVSNRTHTGANFYAGINVFVDAVDNDSVFTYFVDKVQVVQQSDPLTPSWEPGVGGFITFGGLPVILERPA